ncbi:helix-turn-helix domain-containing protein [Deinococcus fonticola]|uniref:helix-turn-helix domain-containing protein n=1 Tax=Deinococcus fonticola TaxID=2528713 RepID=UPI0010757E8F|nr:helix-turn-helix domain-containing protein [Deinococcus fonticola]
MTVNNDAPRLTFQPEEVAPMLGIGRGSIYQLIRARQIRSIRVGRKILIPRSAIDEFLNGQQEAK